MQFPVVRTKYILLHIKEVNKSIFSFEWTAKFIFLM